MSMQEINSLNLFVKIDGTGEPIVFVHGHGIDHTICEDHVAGLSKSCETVSYDNGHLVNYEIPDEFNDALAAFLREVR
jgi:hypothetical protein